MQNEILLVAESVSSEKGLAQEVIFEAIESALATATKRRYVEHSNILVNIDKSTGEIGIYECSEESMEKGRQKVEVACNNYRKYFYDKTENVNEYVRKGYI